MTSSLDLFTARNIEDPSPLSYQYSSNFTGLQLLTVGSFNVGLQINTTNVVKFLDANGQTKILNPDLTLQEQGLKNGMTVFILPHDDNSILPIREIPDGNLNTFDSKNINTDLVSISDLPKLRTFTSSYQAYNSVSDFNFSDHTDASDGSEFGTLKISDLAKNFGIDTHDSGKSVTILTYDGFRSRTNLECIYFLHFSYHEMCETARKFLGLPKKKYVLLMRFSDEESKWFEPGHYLEEYNPFNNMKMFVFTTKIQLRVITKYLPPVECVVELMKTVKEIIPEIAKQLGMDSYYAYSLYKKKNHDINQHELLEDELSLPQQTRSIREVLFLRRFFIFTGYDLVSFTSAFNAFRDAREEFLYGKLHCDIKQVIVLASYSLLIDPPDGYEFDFSMIPETISNIVPKNFASNPAVREGIKTFFNTREKPNRGDAIRIFLRIIRLIPSFAAERYKAKLQIHEKNGSNYIDCQLFFCHHRLIITITDDQEIDNEIYYQKITESSIKSHKITIKYRKQPRIYDVVVLRSKYADEIYSVLSGFESVFKSILQRRAIERAHETGDDVSLLDEEDQIGLFTQLSRSDDANPQLFIYDRRITGGQLIIQAMKNLNLNVNVKYSILFQIRENTFKWIKPNETLFGMNIDDGMIAYMIEINARLRLHLTDESSKMVIYDVTKPVRELVKLTFEKLHMSEIVGYTFFFKNNPQKALDTRFSIPEQCTEYSDLIFKRRFFILTVSDLINLPVLRQTYHDTKYYVLNQDVEINEDQAIDLGILSVIIDTPVNGDVRQTFGHTDFEGLFPKQIKITQKFTTKFHSVFKSFDITIDECAAMRRYIKLARDLPKFGSETVKTNYKLLGKNKKSKFFEGQIIVCPLFLILEDITSKKEVFKIYYHQIISYKSADKAMTLTFIDSKGVNSTTYGFKSENLDTILMLISETIGILRKSIIDRQNEKAAENLAIKQRLDGGWVDENGRVRRKMIDMRLSLSLTKETNLPLYWFEVELTKEELIELLVRNNRKLDPKKSYSLLAKMINRNPKFRFLKKGEKISDINPTRDFLMFIIESNLILKITTLLHQVKSILIPIEKNIKELIPIIAEKFALTNCIGYTLFSTDNNSQKPLELYLTIPEQMSEFQIILLKRRFFVITTKDYAHMGSMLTTFNDVRDLILSGKMDVPVGDALKLAYYALYIDLPRIPSPEDIPKDIQSLLPINISSKSSYIKILKNYCTTPIDNIVNSREMAIRKYLDISRSIPTFGCEPFQATMQDKKNKIVKITLLVGPTKLFGRKTNGKYFLTIGYDHIIKISSINKQILIKYHDESLNQFTYFEFECEKSQEFLDVQRTYVEISDEVLLSRIPSAGNITESLYISNLDRIELQIEYRNSGETIHCPYDKRLNGLQLAQKVSHNLKKNPNGQYTCLLELSPEDKIWVKPTQILGMLHPFKHAKLHLFENNMLVSITPDDGISRKVIIDITQTVSDLISFIADRLYVDNWIGYCLYSSNGEPLDYQKSVPEQINDFSNLIFKRRLFRVTKYDIETPNIALRLFSDFRKNALSNICKPTENQVIAMATLLLYADGKSPEEVQKNQLSKNMHDIEYILPQGYNPRSDLIRKIEKIKSDKLFNKTEAMIKFIHDTKNIKYFGYEQFLRVSVLTQNKKNREVNILIGPKGVKIYHYATHEENDIKYKQILEINIMKDIILLKVVADGNGDKDKVVDFLFMANTAERIYNLIDAYRNIIIPQLKARKQLQKGSESINTDILDPNTILLEVSRQMGHPHPLHYAFDLDETGIIISNQLINVFLLINSTKNQILHRSPEGELSWLPDNGKFRSLNPTIGSRIFFTQLNTPVKVIISNNLIIQSIISIQEFISKNVQVIISDLNNKFFEGFTLYPLAPERLIPLSLNKSLPEQTTSFTELYIRRRFYVFPSLLFDDNNSVFMLYDDCKRMVMNEEVELNEEKALDLAYFTIYADLNEKSFFLSPTIFEDLSPFIPPSIISSSNLINKFKTLIKQFPPMSELEAAYHYIEQCVVLHGFGCEIYECFYNDVINSNKRQHRISKLYLGPFLIEVIDFQSHRKYAYFDYSSIISYFIENGNLHFKYFDDEKNENHIMLEIDHVEEAHEYVKQMFVYFADDYYLRSPSEIINEINFKLAKKASQVHTTENSNYRISYTQEDDYSQDYQDLSLDVNAESYDCCYSIPDINDDDNDEYHYIDRPVDMYGNDDNYKWRMDQDGLKIDRVGRMLDALDDELHDVIDKLNEMNYDTLIDKFAVIENLVNTLRESDISDKFKQKVDKMDSLINEIRETIDKFDGNEGDMRFYVGVLTEKFTAMMNDVIPMKKLIIGERQLKITMENITDPLVRNVIDVSEALEELAASLSRSLRNFNGIDPKSYINTIHVMSERLTALASSLSDTKDPNFVEGSIVPALQETIKLLEKLPSLGISNPLSDNIIRMIVSIEKMIANTAESRNKTANLMYCGDNKAIHTSISALLMVSSAVEKYIESPLHKTNILTAQLISTTRIRIFEAKQVVSNQMKLMKNDFSNATFRYRSLYAILSAEKLSKQLIEHLSDNQAQVSKEENILNYLDTSIKAITTINMIPSNIGLILQNIDLILTYHTKIKPGILEKQLSNIECIIIAETIAVLKEIHFIGCPVM
ncbi:hypothetical protein TRFO_26696 [Tritrichomonas foetus]|uniref:FERM domain-containing protein n=1 Tax=Tritrichomonas foetus TaxID=1144522 RepID=A0A1J4K751_9EUKA|nr:hypothetical protein TRFO_26696 [Tritrichomonas foetus]|eukprot:OHT05550.1 hypothetical protein TRFO_26696 [Tritrichomonas foetus]